MRSTSSNHRSTPVADEIRRSRVIEWSLVTPLTREQAGIADRQDIVIYDVAGPTEGFDLGVVLPDRIEIHRRVSDVSVRATGASGPPVEIDAAIRNRTLDEIHAIVAELATVVGVDDSAVAAWYEVARARVAGTTEGVRNHTFPAVAHGDASVEITGATEYRSDRASLYLVVRWSP